MLYSIKTVRNHPVYKQNYRKGMARLCPFCFTTKRYKKMINKIKKELYEFQLLLKSIPTITVVLFIMSVFSMNLMANKSISLPFDWLALDCGILFSWLTFLIMDITTKHFGPKAASELSIFAIIINLLFCILFFLSSKISGIWSEAYQSQELINTALNRTFGGTWYVVLGSSFAFLISSLVNNFLNYAIGKTFKRTPDSLIAYISSAYISTAVAQFADNLIFALFVSHIFFGWSLIQCITCALTGMIVELLCEFLFSIFGFKICLKWKNEKVGKEYFEYIKGDKYI